MLNQPIRITWAMDLASFLSVFTGMVLVSPRSRRGSMHIAGQSRAFNSM
jgi:hypothetical protein